MRIECYTTTKTFFTLRTTKYRGEFRLKAKSANHPEFTPIKIHLNKKLKANYRKVFFIGFLCIFI